MAVFTDAFNRANSGSLGAPWSNLIGAMGIQNNRAYQQSGTADTCAVVDLGPTASEVDVSCTTGGSGGYALYFRVQDASNWWRIVVRYYSYSYDTGYWTYCTDCGYHDCSEGGTCGYRRSEYCSTSGYPSCPASDGCESPGGRCLDGVVNYRSFFTSTGSAIGYAHQLYLQKMVNGALTTTDTPGVGQVSTLRAVTQGSRILIYVNGSGSPTIDRTDATHQAASKVGVGFTSVGINNGDGVDNFSATYNAPPTAPTVTFPNGGETVDKVHTLSWSAGSDPEGGVLKYDVDLTRDGGTTWKRLVSGHNATTFGYDFAPEAASSACRIRVRTVDTAGHVSAWDESNANFIIQHNVAPSAPVLRTPSNGSIVDLAAGHLFDWDFTDPNAEDTQTAYYLRRKLSSASTYEYWNESTGLWQSTEIKNAKSQTDFTFVAGKWTNGNTYNWSVATEDALGFKGPYATDATVTASTGATVTVTGPVSPVTTTAQPVITWTFSDPEGDLQQFYHVVVFTLGQTQIGGFDPATSPNVWTTNEIPSEAVRGVQVGIALMNNQTYVAYVRLKTGGLYSAWTSRAFSLALAPPMTPTVVATDVPESARVDVLIQGRDNLLSTQAASLDTATTGWNPLANTAALTLETTTFKSGGGALRATSSVAGNWGAQCNTQRATLQKAVENARYCAMADVRMGSATSRTVTVTLRFINADQNEVLHTVVASATVTNSAWTHLFVSGDAPTGTAYVDLIVTAFDAAAAGEAVLVDEAKIAPGDEDTWSRGGLVGLTYVNLERSDDQGATWGEVRNAATLPLTLDNHQRSLIYDYEALPNNESIYRVKTLADL